MKTLLYLSFCIYSLSSWSLVFAQDRVPVGTFSEGIITNWEQKSFEGETDYQLVVVDGKTVIKATSNAAASGYFKEISVDLTKTPYLNWSWKIQKPLDPINEKEKSGDDFVARVYVVVKTGPFFFNLQALNYVWSSNQPIEEYWPNPFTSKAMMMVLQSGKEKSGAWVYEKRNIATDFKKVFGEEITQTDAIAIMTDTDNTGENATAFYGDLYFTAD